MEQSYISDQTAPDQASVLKTGKIGLHSLQRLQQSRHDAASLLNALVALTFLEQIAARNAPLAEQLVRWSPSTLNELARLDAVVGPQAFDRFPHNLKASNAQAAASEACVGPACAGC